MRSYRPVAGIAAFVFVALLPVAGFSAGMEAGGIPSPPAIECSGQEHTLFLAQGDVILRNLRWRVPGTGQAGCGTAVPHLQDTGHFWFFDSENLELTCKVIDGHAVNQKYWVFCGALTNVEWWVEARNNANPGLPEKIYYNPPGTMASFADVSALGPGENSAPVFPAETTQCGALINWAGAGYSDVHVRVKDPDGDPLTATVRLIQGDGSAVGILPRWQNPIDPASSGMLEVDLSWPNVAATYVFAVEASDGKVAAPPFCTVTLRVFKFP